MLRTKFDALGGTEAGGTAEECEGKAEADLERCLGVCDKEPPEPKTCAERCAHAVDKIAAGCARRGGSEEEVSEAICAERAVDLEASSC